jgi:hypothetical protein
MCVGPDENPALLFSAPPSQTSQTDSPRLPRGQPAVTFDLAQVSLRGAPERGVEWLADSLSRRSISLLAIKSRGRHRSILKRIREGGFSKFGSFSLANLPRRGWKGERYKRSSAG